MKLSTKGAFAPCSGKALSAAPMASRLAMPHPSPSLAAGAAAAAATWEALQHSQSSCAVIERHNLRRRLAPCGAAPAAVAVLDRANAFSSLASGGSIDDEVAPPPEFPIPRGETAGATLVLEGVTVQAGDRDLLSEVSWRLMPGQRAGLVGANGAGKSTLLRCLCGLRGVDAGTAITAHNVQVGYLEQTAVGGSMRTVWQEARSRMTGLVAAEAAMQRAERELEAGDASAAERFASAREAWELAGGPESERTITTVLQGLGFRPVDFHRSCAEFSGGWQMRIALARLLLGPAGQGGGAGALLLLDEPTNHLDSAACSWLGSYLRSGLAPGTSVVLVSHDEALLDQACDRIVEVRGRRLHNYVGGFKKFLQLRAERETQARAEAEAQQAEIAKLEEFIARFGAKASKASQAQSKAKLLAKLKAEQVEIPAAAASTGGGDAKKVALRLPRAPPCATEAMKLSKAVVGWGTPPQQQQEEHQGAAGNGAPAGPAPEPLLRGVDLVIRKGQRVLVLGPNGAGKSSLLKAMSGALPLWGGSRQLGDGVKLGVFNQDLAQDLPLDRTALDYVEEEARKFDPSVTIEKCRQALGALGLNNSTALARIGVLSGGEKARVALAVFALVPANVLLLDEASNHLDAQTIEVLTGALREFEGAIVAITHNQAFAQSLNATHVLRVADGAARLGDNLGLTAADFDHRPKQAGQPAAAAAAAAAKGGKGGKGAARGAAPQAAAKAAPAAAAPPPPAPAAPAASAKSKAKRTTLAYKEQLEYQRLGKELDALGKQRDKLQEEVAAAAAAGIYARVEKASTQLAKVVEQLEDKELRWLELAELAGDI